MFRDSASEEEIGGFFNNFALMAVPANEFEKATKLYNSAHDALESKDLRSKVKFNLGLAYRKWQKPALAISSFEKALELNPEYEKAMRLLEILSAETANTQPVEVIKSPAASLAEFGPDIEGWEDSSVPLWSKPIVKSDEKVVSPFSIEILAKDSKAGKPQKNDAPAGKNIARTPEATPAPSSGQASKASVASFFDEEEDF